mmetsp:Transcript_10402/g.23537  ORF Transcript_10402/g.23537 Transcript_10402/m.23537 type:complete len:454 (-) Transcript_10402:328-1689(-)
MPSFAVFKTAVAVALLGKQSLASRGAYETVIADVAANVSRKYNCSVSIAVRTADVNATAAHGFVDFSSNRQAATEDEYAWGSVTKSVTGASIMRLVADGKLSLSSRVDALVDPLLERMAQRDPDMKFRSLADLFGKDHASQLDVKSLLAMTSGVPDFDTATPCIRTGCTATDPLRVQLYEQANHSFSPLQLISEPWVAGQWKQCRQLPIGTLKHVCYSSTNFMLLGFILAGALGKERWEELDQLQFLPSEFRGRLHFATDQAPSDFTHVHGYDRTSYGKPQGEVANHDNIDVKGVFSGWTASNLVASAPAVADLGWAIYGPAASVAPPEYIKQMLPRSKMEFYGLATFNLAFLTGGKAHAYGHLGATYGYQSVLAYFPDLQLSLAVATNLETDKQSQVMEAACLTFNALSDEIHGHPVRQCTFKSTGFFGGVCQCSEPSVGEQEEATPFIVSV